MTVYRPAGAKSFKFDFWYAGTRHVGNTHQLTKAEAERVEAKAKEHARQVAAGIVIPGRGASPRFQDWAEVFYVYKSTRLERPEAIADILGVALRFWGRPEDIEPSPAHPCHDLRLCDPIDDPDWLLKFDEWLVARGLGPQSRNHYRGLMRRMYAVALLPKFRKATNVSLNPFVGIEHDYAPSREVTVSRKHLRAWITNASYHVRLAIAIGALAHKLRLHNILALEWGVHFDPDPRTTKFSPKVAHYITISHHKTARKTRRPLVVPISEQLLRILKDAWRRQPMSDRVVTYRGKAVKQIVGGVRAAAEAAGLPYGRDRPDGVTFHTLRHTATTLMSDQLADPLKLMDAAGHTDIATTLKYRHKRPKHQRPAFEGLSRSLAIEDIVTLRRNRGQRARESADAGGGTIRGTKSG